jgi:hypothetical protein
MIWYYITIAASVGTGLLNLCTVYYLSKGK